MCRPDDFPPYEDWNRNGPLDGDILGSPAGSGPAAGEVGDHPTRLTCECGGDPDGFRHTMSLLHMTLVNRKRDLIEGWREASGWIRQRVLR